VEVKVSARELTAENWLVKTTSSTAGVVIYNGNEGNITFNVPFIENVSKEVLEAIDSDGQEFVEATGGTITVTNNGAITEEAEPTPTPTPTPSSTPTPTSSPEPTSTPQPTSTLQPTGTPTPTESPGASSTPEPTDGLGGNEEPDGNFIYVVIVAVVVVGVLLFLVTRKKLFKNSDS